MKVYLLNTDTASRLMRADRATVNAMRRASPASISISAATQAELLYGARLRVGTPALMAAVRAFLARVTVHPWDQNSSEHHADIRAAAKNSGHSAGTLDIMIAAHARALGATLVTSDKAIGSLGIDGLDIVSWAGRRSRSDR